MLEQMSARVCVQHLQGLALCSRGERDCYRTPKALRKTEFLQHAGRLSCGRLTMVKESRVRLWHARTYKWFDNYSDPPNPSQDLGTDEFDSLCGEVELSSSSYAQSSQVGANSDVRIPPLKGLADGHVQKGGSTFTNAGDVATRHGFREFEQIQGDEKIEIDPELGLDDLDYYVPVPGHRVVGVVVSGNHARLEVDIGAAKLGYLHVLDLQPLDQFDIDDKKWVLADDGGEGGSHGAPPYGHPYVIYDQEVHTYAAPDPLAVDIGTVLEMEVVGQTMLGNPLLSARRATQQLAWDRVMQMKDENEPVQVKIVDFSKAGVITRVEGLRAFLPLAEFVKRPDAAKCDSHEAYVGRTLWVTIAYARESRGNITLSEKDVWIKRNLELRSLLDCTVTKIFNYGALVQVNDTDIWGMIHISNIADERISEVSDVFEIGEQVKVIVIKSPVPDKLAFSTALLESEPGLMLRDKERVFREAEQRTIELRNEHPEWKQPVENDDEGKPTSWIPSKPISNLEWVEFQQR